MVQKGEMNSGDLFAIFGILLFSNFSLIMLQGSLQAEQKAIASGGRILDFTTHVPNINFDGGLKPSTFAGHIEFRSVSFKYPTRDVYALRNVSFVIEPGQIGALVGHSGSGKSTCVQLLERFYDVTEGVVLLDGHDIRSLDPRWLHQKMALVSQEPSLFQMTIAENIKYGKADATQQEIEEAAEVANARRFIEKLDNGFNQMVGEKGSSLSGGQRQRVAIARAVVRNPVILITDEATSALDSASEKRVQVALDHVMEGRTAVVVAHRLSTIRNAHVIYVFDCGEIKEVGKHEDLVEKKGFYYELVKRQLTKGEDAGSSEENGDERAKGVKPSSSESESSSPEEEAPRKPNRKAGVPTKKVPKKKVEAKKTVTVKKNPKKVEMDSESELESLSSDTESASSSESSSSADTSSASSESSTAEEEEESSEETTESSTEEASEESSS
jgi:ABC-type multidrug transport system fused ATPase/permease subunit